MICASTFLSHSSVDKELVEAVARELGKRGIISWLDKKELSPGVSLRESLENAIREQVTVTLFLSEEAVKSPWVKEELKVALELDENGERKDSIIPLYLGNPLELINMSDVLRSKWLHADGDRVDRLGVIVKTGKDSSASAKEISEGIARQIYKTLGISRKQELVICIDQRGEGTRRGIPKDIPQNIDKLEAPALVFRPDLGDRTQGDTLPILEWEDMSQTMKWALSEALEGVRWADPKKIRILGASQLGFPFVLGQYFNRSTSAHLFCTNPDGIVFNNQDQRRDCPPEGGNKNCEEPSISAIPKGKHLDAISLLLSGDYLLPKVQRYLAAVEDSPPLVWVKSERFTDNQQVMDYVSNVVALLKRFSEEHGVRTVNLYCGLPFHVLPLLAANLLNVIDNVIFMEYRKDLQNTGAKDEDMYIALPTK